MTRTAAELKFATRILLERHRCLRWTPMAPAAAPAAAAPIARRLAAREPAPVAEDRRPAWMARMRAKEIREPV